MNKDAQSTSMSDAPTPKSSPPPMPLEAATKRVETQVPQVLTVFLVSAAITILTGLIAAHSVVLTLPILAMIAFWPAITGCQIKKALSTSDSIVNSSSLLGRFAVFLVCLGVSPVILGFIGLLLTFGMSGTEGRLAIRFLLVGYAVFVIPSTLYFRTDALRLDWKSAMPRNWLLKVGGATLLGTVVVSATIVVIFDLGSSGNLGDRIDSAEKDLAAAHELWEGDERFEAVKQYKTFLRTEERIHFHDDLPVLYRRVIEHEAEYGDPSDCRDWCLRAYEEWPGRPMKLTFGSETATKIWSDVTSAARSR